MQTQTDVNSICHSCSTCMSHLEMLYILELLQKKIAEDNHKNSLDELDSG